LDGEVQGFKNKLGEARKSVKLRGCFLQTGCGKLEYLR
jgi:hypothetical protein